MRESFAATIPVGAHRVPSSGELGRQDEMPLIAGRVCGGERTPGCAGRRGPRPRASGHVRPAATSTSRQSALASCIWWGVAQETRTSAGDATTSATQRAREVATFNRLSE